MLLDKNDKYLLLWLQDMVSKNKRSIFGDNNDGFQILHVGISGPLHHKSDRCHRLLKVSYTTSRCVYTKRIWLKFCNEYGRSYKIHSAVYNRFQENQKIFPKPYFYGEFDRNRGSVMAMEFLEGVSLRDKLLKNLAYRKFKPLKKIFSRIGAGMRTFHDSSTSSGVRSVSTLASNARRVTEMSQYLTDKESEEMIRYIGIAEKQAGPQTELPMIKIHNDWILKNILISKTGTVHVVDLDSTQAPDNSRWYDLSYFLINVESQFKYWPIINRISLVNLWKSFWKSYSEKGFPDILSKEQIIAIIYLIKVEYLFGGTIRRPLFEMYHKPLGTIYLRKLKKTMLRGEYSILSVDLL